MKIEKIKKFNTSTYESLETKDFIYVGGSDWDRRRVKYSKKIAKNSKGILWIFKKRGKELTLFKKLSFPSMVYPLVEISSKRILVCCKSEDKTLNLISKEGKIISQKDESIGKGIYDLVYDKKRKEIILATRKGYLLWLDKNLNLLKKMKLSSNERLWSIKRDSKKDEIYVGDYAGVLYILDGREKKLIKKIDFRKKFYKKDKRVKKGLGPSLWGLELKGRYVIIANRWGDIILILNKKIISRTKTEEQFTKAIYFKKNLVFLGTRDGKIFIFNIQTKQFKEIYKIHKTFQKENSIYGMNKFRNNLLVCFADGELIRIK